LEKSLNYLHTVMLLPLCIQCPAQKKKQSTKKPHQTKNSPLRCFYFYDKLNLFLLKNLRQGSLAFLYLLSRKFYSTGNYCCDLK